jgi:hypothetical protein
MRNTFSSPTCAPFHVTDFSEARRKAQRLLSRLAGDLEGRVFVYRSKPFDWRRVFEGCYDELAYANSPYAGDYHFAKTMLSAGAPWVTRNASEARLFVVPTLFGLGPETNVGPLLHSPYVNVAGSNSSSSQDRAVPAHCTDTLYRDVLDHTRAALKASPYWGKRPHLFLTAGFKTLAGCSSGGRWRKSRRNTSTVRFSSTELRFQRDHCA